MRASVLWLLVTCLAVPFGDRVAANQKEHAARQRDAEEFEEDELLLAPQFHHGARHRIEFDHSDRPHVRQRVPEIYQAKDGDRGEDHGHSASAGAAPM